ncbi:putative disease resistance protein RGA3 isoform X2 [Miscanthus floridulus]|uniref:putative disease resistance protein RGA3 isoform X2 n=1 Tax=Miscanthus floridulus TaxID=154761 RepID=UPI003459EBA8
MSFHLKQCFAICSVFPKGYKIDKEKLIDLWIAHDMITPENGVEYLEHIGQRCFDSLLQMSFLQEVYEGYGRVTYTMHDLIHDLALAIMDEEILPLVPKVATSSTKSYRYFSITEQPRNLLSENLFKEERAVYVADGDYFKFGRALQNAKHLRSITVKYAESVPTTIFQAKNLKYLEISGLKCEMLPEAISDIWSLEALQLTNGDILNLPKSIGNLKKLRTLNLSCCKRLKSLPGSVSSCHMISNMDLSGCIEFEVLPEFTGTNKRLIVLRISHTKIKRLPPSIILLKNLECLDLQWCRELVELPEGIENLEKLEVLNLKGCNKLRIMPTGIGKLNQIQILSTFVVAEGEKSARITELGNIRMITGDLSIRGIACVSVMNLDDAHNACLKEKTNLQRLQLHWGRNDAGKERNVEAIFDALQPPPEIKELYISEYAGVRCTRWMLNQVGGGVQGRPQFPLLTVMTLYGFQNLNNLEGLMELPCLEELKLQWMPLLRSISGGPFPSLVKLRMEGLRSLGEVRMADETLPDGDGGRIKIEHLVLKRSNDQLLLLPGQGQGEGPSSSSSLPPSCSFSQLNKLELWGMAASSSSPTAAPGSGSKHEWELLQRMTALESLKIYQCGGLTELPDSMRSLTSLRSLFINFCSAICMLPEWLGELRLLQKMTIRSCHSLRDLQIIGHLASLQELRIERCDELHQLPESLGELCSLCKFGIASLQGLTFLPKSMCRLTTLEELEISHCQGLTSLPEWIQGLPALQKLKITGCPELERRCKRGTGEDSHLTSHIPHLQFGFDEGPAC